MPKHITPSNNQHNNPTLCRTYNKVQIRKDSYFTYKGQLLISIGTLHRDITSSFLYYTVEIIPFHHTLATPKLPVLYMLEFQLLIWVLNATEMPTPSVKKNNLMIGKS
ncbi:hypothetical protein ES319_D03G076000v1 [Gossypium barbadense]|uniref:Uncharacterized protein n=2 Tax=Gossypium TaxID=3633 RepID=A0A5J5S4R3_GOSBA|nr:hypothetical protein ES319_D03G076000v1 [Gossypium barbadense]TYG76055.1 hypothetical protein ES288_D03G082600v1 [Gossypium darwinii]